MKNIDSLWYVEDYYLNDSLYRSGTFKDKDLKNRVDTFKTYYINGQLSKVHVYNFSVKHGDFLSYDIHGNLAESGTYNMGIPSKRTYYDSEGKEKEVAFDSGPQELINIDHPAIFPGGSAELNRYMDKLEYPFRSGVNGLYGNTLAFIKISATGEVTDVDMIIHGDADMDSAIVKHLRNMPKWEPAIDNGKAISSYFLQKIYFNLGEKKEEISNKKLAYAFYLSGNKDYKNNKLEDAAFKFRMAIKNDNVNAKYYYHLAVSLYNLNKHSEACEYFKIAHSIDNDIVRPDIRKYCNF